MIDKIIKLNNEIIDHILNSEITEYTFESNDSFFNKSLSFAIGGSSYEVFYKSAWNIASIEINNNLNSDSLRSLYDFEVFALSWNDKRQKLLNKKFGKMLQEYRKQEKETKIKELQQELKELRND